MANRIINENLSVREVEEYSKGETVQKVHKIKKKETNDEYKYVEDMMKEKLGTKVKISSNKINISFNNVNDLNRILELLNISE